MLDSDSCILIMQAHIYVFYLIFLGGETKSRSLLESSQSSSKKEETNESSTDETKNVGSEKEKKITVSKAKKRKGPVFIAVNESGIWS